MTNYKKKGEKKTDLVYHECPDVSFLTAMCEIENEKQVENDSQYDNN
jgi:hypothetical protein